MSLKGSKMMLVRLKDVNYSLLFWPSRSGCTLLFACNLVGFFSFKLAQV